MPEFIAVQCFQCNQYQVSQKRKDSKFNCKLCNAKQSVRKVIAHSDKASDVRKFIQPLNLARGRAEEQYDQQNLDTGAEEHDAEEAMPSFSDASSRPREPLVSVTQSRWQPYSVTVAKRFQSPDADEYDEYGDAEDEIITALPDMQGKGRRRKRKRTPRQQRGLAHNNNQRLKVGAEPTTRNEDGKDVQTRDENHSGYLWGAGPVRKKPVTTRGISRETSGTLGRGAYEWGSGKPGYSQSRPRSKPSFNVQQSRWGALARNETQTPERGIAQMSSAANITTTLDADALITSFGTDEVVQDEVLH